jgi:AAA ATPase domain/Protein of unknown function (DUF3696)
VQRIRRGGYRTPGEVEGACYLTAPPNDTLTVEMITRLRAENFKSWRDTGDLRLAPLTGLFGTNSSGKTSILQSLLLLKQTIESPDPRRVLFFGDDRSLVDLGTFGDVIYNHEANLVLKFSLCWDETVGPPFTQGGQIVKWPSCFDAAVVEINDRLRLSGLTYASGSQNVKIRDGPDGYVFARNGEPEFVVGQPFGLHLFPQEVFVPGGIEWNLTIGLQECMKRMTYLGPLRQRPQRTYLWGGNEPSDVGSDGGEAIQALLARYPEVRTSDPVAIWLRRMKLIDSFRIDPIAPNRKDYEIRLKKTQTSAEVLLPDVGFGVSQVLPVLVLCHYVPEGWTIILEQPELHLHPAAQSELADLLIEVVQERKVQIIVESHSEHLLRRLQRRIAEEKFRASDAAFYFCEMQNGESKATPLEITDDGFIKNWPKDFFGDEMGDLAAMTEAAARRHLSTAK